MADAEEPKTDPSELARRHRHKMEMRRSRRKKRALAALNACASGRVSKEQVESAVARTRRGMRGISGLAAEALVEIMADPGVQAGTRVKAATYLLTGAGVTQPGVPVTEEERRKMDEEAEAMAALPVEQLAEIVYKEAGATPLPEKVK